MNKADIKPLVHYFGGKYKIPPRFLAALIQTESNWCPYAVRYEPHYMWVYKTDEYARKLGCSLDTAIMLQKTSFGLTQIMGANLYSLLDWEDWPCKAMDPETNIKLGCEFLIKLIKKHDLAFANPLDVYAAFNAGSVRKSGDQYVNASAVTNFRKNWEKLSTEFDLY